MFYNKITKKENNKYGQKKLKNQKNLGGKIMLKNKKGITLIALVVTIVVLLILAGVTISLLLDENGIIAKSKDARAETRVSQIEDEVGMWKQHNFINKESNQAQENADTMLANLISRKLLTEEEIDRDQELITIKKKDGTIVKEISYSSVTINISKTLATEKSGVVILKVESVEGLPIQTIKNEEEFTSFANSITSLSEERKKEIIKKLEPVYINTKFEGTNVTTFEETLDFYKKKRYITEATEETFWNYVESNGGMDEYVLKDIMYVCFDEDTGTLNLYIITNPLDATSNEYIATENGTYTFKIQNIVTGKTYTKKVEVSNIDTTATYEVYNVTESTIGLRNKETKQPTTFSKIYSIYMDEIFNSEHDRIETADDGTYNYAKLDYGYIRLAEKGEVIFLEKDGILYAAKVKIHIDIN